MSFTIDIQRSRAEKERLDKSDYLTTILSVQGELKDESSIIDPVIRIQCDLSTVKNANYMTIQEFNRSYFITDMKSITKDIVEFYCHVDVLHSFRSAIKGNEAIIQRQQNNWNLYLNDSQIKTYQYRNVQTFEFKGGNQSQFGDDYDFVLAVAGR